MTARAFFRSRVGASNRAVADLKTAIFFFQAEDGIRDLTVTGVQTCALPILAVARDDSLAGPYRLLSQVSLWQKEHARAIAQAERAVALAPNDADTYENLAEVLAWSGMAEEAIGYIKQAMRLNPRYPFFYSWTLGHALYLTGRSDDAIATLKKVLERNPNFVPAHAFLVVLYSEQGLEREARAEAAAASRLSPQASVESLRQIVPYKNQRDLDRFLAAMRKSGLK